MPRARSWDRHRAGCSEAVARAGRTVHPQRVPVRLVELHRHSHAATPAEKDGDLAIHLDDVLAPRMILGRAGKREREREDGIAYPCHRRPRYLRAWRFRSSLRIDRGAGSAEPREPQQSFTVCLTFSAWHWVSECVANRSRAGPGRLLADLPALAREEEPVPGCIRAVEARPRGEAREDPVLPDRPVREHRRLRVEHGVARARRRVAFFAIDTPTQSSSHLRAGGPRRPLKMSQRRTVVPNPVSTPQAMFFDGILNVTNFAFRPRELLAAVAIASRTSTRVRRRTRRLCRKGEIPA